MESCKNIAILLATYNGDRFIAEQIESILCQTYSEWTLYVHDDGSSDSTMDTLRKFENTDPRIKILHYPVQGGAKNNFFSILNHVEAPYYMFCDQDDVWNENKIAIEMQKMVSLEKEHDIVCIATDLEVVDENLNRIAPSMWQYAGLHPELMKNFDDYAGGTFMTGCTMLFNNNARKSIILPATKAIMHDAWIELCIAKIGGKIEYMNTATVKYRQHGANVLGAQDIGKISVFYKLRNLPFIVTSFFAHYKMLKALGYRSLAKCIYKRIMYRRKAITLQ